MENSSLSSDDVTWNDVTTSSSKDDELNLYLAHIRYLALKVSYIVIGTVGVVDNLFVIVVFAMFIKITDKVIIIITRMWANAQRDGRPAEYRWRPLFNAAKFG